MDKLKKSTFAIRQSVALASNPALGVACPGLSAALQPGNLAQSHPPSVDRMDVAINSSITSFKAIKVIVEAIPQVGPIEATCSVMILVLENIKGFSCLFIPSAVKIIGTDGEDSPKSCKIRIGV
ncbi:hypothetical protein CPB86DRAFT_783832 [Serendipita vermifera]|nr:hypothetical protein CPB86DRAFT_783832 [Serendipita vermifera]